MSASDSQEGGRLLGGCLFRFVLMICGSLCMSAGFAEEQSADEDSGDGGPIEEVVVVGSKLLGIEESVSPVIVLDNEAFQQTPRASLSDFFLVEVTSNVGMDSFFESSNQGGRQRGARGSSINLRYLGEENTLILINGNRTIEYAAPGNDGWRSVDIDATIPRVAVRQTQILLDGGSAIYGTDAVAGVVNFIPDYDYKGWRFQANSQFFEDAVNYQDNSFGVMWGGGNARTNVIAAFELVRKNPPSPAQDDSTNVNFDPQPGDLEWTEAVGSTTNTWNRIDVSVPPAPMGMGMGMAPPVSTEPVASIDTAQFPDPLCGNADALGIDPLFAGITGGPVTVAAGGGMGMGMGGGGAAPPTTDPMLGVLQDACYSFGLPANARQGRNTDNYVGLLAVKHEFSTRLNGSLEFSFSQQTLDDFHHYGNAPYTTGPTGTALLDGWVLTQDHPAVAYYADNYYDLTGASPGSPNPWANEHGVVPVQTFNHQSFHDIRKTQQIADMWRVGGSLQYQLNDYWALQAGMTLASHQVENVRPDLLPDRLQAALMGLGGEGCSGGVPGQGACEYWNPFMSAALSNAEDLGLANSRALRDWIYPGATTNYEADFASVNLAAVGVLPGLRLPGGPVGVALGIEYREDKLDGDYDDRYNSGGWPRLTPFNVIDGVSISTPVEDYAGDTSVAGIIVDLSLPVTDDLNVQIAGRYEDYESGNGYAKFSPKIGFNWFITPKVRVRAAYNSSFKAPSIDHVSYSQVLATSRNNLALANPEDPNIINDTASPSDDFFVDVVQISIANEDLDPQESEAFSAGLQVDLTDSLTFNLDYVKIEFENIIDRLNLAQTLSRPECHQVMSTTDANGVPFTYLSPIDDSANQNCFALDPVTGIPRTAYLNYRNLAFRDTENIDFRFTYRLDTSIGVFTISPGGTWFMTYDVKEEEGGETVDGVGKRLLFGNGPSEWRVNLPISWRFGRHSASLTGRYISALDPLAVTDTTILDGDFISTDFRYVFQINDSASVGLVVSNVFSEIPDNERGNFPLDRRRIGLQFSWDLESG